MTKTVRVSSVAGLADPSANLVVSPQARLRRTGPYPTYVENCLVEYIDDYTVEAGGAVMVPGLGAIIGPDGTIAARLEKGRFSADPNVHALIPFDRTDATYLWRALTTSYRAAIFVEGSRPLQRLDEQSLLAIPIPWPEREARDAYVAELDRLEQKIAQAHKAVPELLAQGDRAFAQLVLGAQGSQQTVVRLGDVSAWAEGTQVPAEDRGDKKPFPVETAMGQLGSCDEALTDSPSIVVGKVGTALLARFISVPAHPINTVRYTVQDRCQVPIEALFFAMRAADMAGVAKKRTDKDGRRVPAPKIALEDIEDVSLIVGDLASWQAFVPVAKDLLARMAQAQNDEAAAREERLAFIDAFFADLERPTPLELEVSCDAPQATPAADPLADLGSLAPLAQAALGMMKGDDLAWELAPLALLRACVSAEAWAKVAQGAQNPDQVVEAIDAGLDQLAVECDALPFLSGLSFKNSLLSHEALAGWVRALDGIEANAISAGNVRAAFELGERAKVIPAEVQGLLDSLLRTVVVRCLPTDAASGFLMRDGAESFMDIAGAVAPQISWRAQMQSFEQALKATMVRAVQMRGMWDTCGGLSAAEGDPLAVDAFADWKAQLVTGIMPVDDAQWTQRVEHDDPRWLLGIPPCTHSAFAWLQHALRHLDQDGVAVILAHDTVLGSTYANEPKLRSALVESGRLRAVISLPGRIWGDEREPMSILVLGAPLEGDAQVACLMVNATDLGQPIPGADPQAHPQRVLPACVAQRIASVCDAWFARGVCQAEPGFARIVGIPEIMANNALLGPWAYA